MTPIKCVKNTLIGGGGLCPQSGESEVEDLTCPLSLTVYLEDKITESFEICTNFIFRCSFSTWRQPFCSQLAAVLCMSALPLARGPAGLLLSVRLQGKVGGARITQCGH